MPKYSRQPAREAEQKARAYQALVAQAEIELAFHSPERVGSWHARWSDRVAEHDLETLFWQWGERSVTGRNGTLAVAGYAVLAGCPEASLAAEKDQ